jgi:hypothetical protein
MWIWNVDRRECGQCNCIDLVWTDGYQVGLKDVGRPISHWKALNILFKNAYSASVNLHLDRHLQSLRK